MTDLDRQIAEAKGMKDPDKLEGLEVIALIGGDYSWSTRDEKAMELVDELLKGPLKGRVDVSLGYACKPGVWTCEISVDSMTEVEVWDATRPEAICRAYLAAVAWMKEKKG